MKGCRNYKNKKLHSMVYFCRNRKFRGLLMQSQTKQNYCNYRFFFAKNLKCINYFILTAQILILYEKLNVVECLVLFNSKLIRSNVLSLTQFKFIYF